MDKIWEIARKEWSEVFKNRFVVFTVAFMPLLFTFIPLAILYSMRGATSLEAIGASDIPAAALTQICGDLPSAECARVYIASQFLILFMIMPIMIPVTIASYSIVGEKRTRTLEPLLATPISTVELLGGKMLSAVVPALVATWAAFVLFVVGALWITGSGELAGRFFSPLWMLSTFIVAPLLSLMGVSLAVMVSSRVNDPRVAEQLSAMVIMPVIALFLGQTFGLVQLNQNLIVWITLALLVIDALLLFLATQFFQRETILTRWK